MTHRHTAAQAPLNAEQREFQRRLNSPITWAEFAQFTNTEEFHGLIHFHTGCWHARKKMFVYGFLAGLVSAAIVTAPLYGAVYGLTKTCWTNNDETCRLK